MQIFLLVGKDETTVLVVSTIAWGLCKISLVIVLILLLQMATKPGYIHAIYSKLIIVFTCLVYASTNHCFCKHLIHLLMMFVLDDLSCLLYNSSSKAYGRYKTTKIVDSSLRGTFRSALYSSA